MGFRTRYNLVCFLDTSERVRNVRMFGAHSLTSLFLFRPSYVFRHFSAAFCTAHCALDLARDHAP